MKIFILFGLIIYIPSFLAQLETPEHYILDSIIKHNAYSLAFNRKYHQSNWVGYCLTRNETNSIFKRRK